MKKLTLLCDIIPIDKIVIHNFQRLFFIKFPNYFVAFLLDYNGADTKECVFIDKYIVNNFLPLLKNRNASIELILPAVRSKEEEISRDDLIPFAIDPGGRPYYFSIGEEDYGNVYIDRMGAGHKNPLLKIAESFEEFINGLEPESLD
jgi:hypothetical protein